ncbi:MAG TPA: right-handed parallel beta-helix repeat-containing protein [Candidatus Binatia bacterium]|nr:right-handed parallel beta-helix repeat-containing protein [Candidatus Binatia bacterium]
METRKIDKRPRAKHIMKASRCSSSLLTVSVLLVLAFSVLLPRPVLAEHRTLYVDAAATERGDGSRHRPFWRITDAVVRARVLRQERHGQEGRIVIQVRPGTYTGSHDAADLAGNPRLELLPIILNVSNLSLRGGTEFEEDADGLLTGVHSRESETLITTTRERPLMRGQVLLLIATTTDGMTGNRVSVSGFVMDARALGLEGTRGFDIYADRVSDFSIHHNLLRNGSGGAQTRLATGLFEANLCGPNNDIAIFVTAGSMAYPATVTLRRNRSIRNGAGAAVTAVASFVQLDLGANTLRLEPLQMSYDINNPEDQQNVPGTLEATIEGNDFSDNNFSGLRCTFFPPFYYTTADATQPIRGSLSVTVHDNRFNRNLGYGIEVDASNAYRSNPRQLTGTFEGTFERNVLIGNGRNAFAFSFTDIRASIGTVSRQDVKYMQESTFEVADLDGELEGFDFDHPLDDPFDGRPVVGNVLVINGEIQPNGIQITPLP